MVAPAPGYVWGAGRAARLAGRVHLVHTDFSGISLFEETFHQGERAARAVLGPAAS